jgi:hypothetical protein
LLERSLDFLFERFLDCGSLMIEGKRTCDDEHLLRKIDSVRFQKPKSFASARDLR